MQDILSMHADRPSKAGPPATIEGQNANFQSFNFHLLYLHVSVLLPRQPLACIQLTLLDHKEHRACSALANLVPKTVLLGDALDIARTFASHDIWREFRCAS